jgi:hypothetical protein
MITKSCPGYKLSTPREFKIGCDWKHCHEMFGISFVQNILVLRNKSHINLLCQHKVNSNICPQHILFISIKQYIIQNVLDKHYFKIREVCFRLSLNLHWYIMKSTFHDLLEMYIKGGQMTITCSKEMNMNKTWRPKI